MNGKLIKQLNFKTLFSIALPISIQSLLQSSLGMIDQIMIGQLGETAVASVNLGTRLMFIMVYSLSGISAVSSIYTSQYEGAGTKEKHSAVMKITILEGLLCVLPFLIECITATVAAIPATASPASANANFFPPSLISFSDS